MREPLAQLQRTLILAPRGRDAVVATGILREAGLRSEVCGSLTSLIDEIQLGADVAIATEEAIRGSDIRDLARWVTMQPPWSDFPFILLTQHGGGIERNPAAARLTGTLGNVTFLERPFHPTTLVSVVRTALRGRLRQYECQRLSEEQEIRVQERTAELAATNRQLLSEIEERGRVESTLRQMQRLEAVGQLTSGVAHDFNNLLTVILGNLRFLDKGLAKAGLDGALTQRLGFMRSAAERGAKLTHQLLSFSRRQHLEPRAIDLNASVASMRDLLQSSIGGSIEIETRLGEAVWPAMVDPTQLELAVLNLAINARDAMQVGGKVTVETANLTADQPVHPEEPSPGEYVVIAVTDTGEGMSESVRAKVFEPFFTTKEVGKGSGLGLSQVLGFAKQSGGGVRIHSRLGKGTCVQILLPRADRTAASAESEPASDCDLPDVTAARILLVDDDSAVREVAGTLLRDLGYEVVEAGSGGAAIDLLAQGQAFDLAVIDFAMPGMNGADVARELRTRRPTLPILFVTGYADRTRLTNIGEDHVIGKPFIHDELVNKVRSTLINGAGRSPLPDA